MTNDFDPADRREGSCGPGPCDAAAGGGLPRRVVLQAGAAASMLAGPLAREAVAAETNPPEGAPGGEAPAPGAEEVRPPVMQTVHLRVNGQDRTLELDTRTSLLDTLREHLHLTGTKKGCDHGQCGACTVISDGQRINSCLTLAVMQEGSDVTTVEGLGRPDALHPMQAAFLHHDGYQCGYCTPGQICSAVGMLDELRKGWPSVVTADLTAPRMELTDAELRERMSGNICRCSAYPNIVAAIRDAAQELPA
jgi:xanthine dehydrogenase YagT iron-sulfur-binding subunit